MKDENKLELQIGDSLQLQFVADESRRRLYSKVIGYLQGHSVLITTPRIEGNIMLVREDQLVIVRMLAGNCIYGFTTSVLKSNLKPYAYLHLAYPKEMEQITVRKAQRVSTQLIASVEVQGVEGKDHESIPVFIIDISTSGAMIIADKPVTEPDNLVMINTKITVGNVQEYISLPAIIRNLRIQAEDGKQKYHYGIEFQLLEQHEHFVLHGYVYEQLLSSMKK